MTGWHRLELGDAILAQAELQRIAEALERIGAAAGADGAPPVYVRHETAASLHCHVTVFFGPGAVELAHELGAEPCTPPPLGGLEALVPQRQ